MVPRGSRPRKAGTEKASSTAAGTERVSSTPVWHREALVHKTARVPRPLGTIATWHREALVHAAGQSVVLRAPRTVSPSPSGAVAPRGSRPRRAGTEKASSTAAGTERVSSTPVWHREALVHKTACVPRPLGTIATWHREALVHAAGQSVVLRAPRTVSPSPSGAVAPRGSRPRRAGTEKASSTAAGTERVSSTPVWHREALVHKTACVPRPLGTIATWHREGLVHAQEPRGDVARRDLAGV